MGTAEWIRCCLWRATLYGFLLGTAFDGFYDAAFGTLIFPLAVAIVEPGASPATGRVGPVVAL